MGDFFNHAMLCPEVEGGGQAAIAYMMKSGYDHIWTHQRPDHNRQSFNMFGWSTTMTRKQWAIGELQHRFLDGSIVIHDPVTYNQLISFVEHEDGYWGNNDKRVHDDAVMALAITITASKALGPFTRYTREMNNPIVDMFNTQEEPDMFASQNGDDMWDTYERYGRAG